jgi:ferrous iron transport protein A
MPANLADPMTLDQLHEGQRARIESLVGDDFVLQRLMEMGVLENEVIEVIGFAPLGDPMEIRLRDYRLSLRRNEAARIRVTILP